MKLRDLVEDVKDWWDLIPGWHERIIWLTGGFALGVFVMVVL